MGEEMFAGESEEEEEGEMGEMFARESEYVRGGGYGLGKKCLPEREECECRRKKRIRVRKSCLPEKDKRDSE